MHTHWVKILNRAYNHHIVLAVPHHLKLIFLPADYRLLNKEFAVRACIKAELDHILKLFAVIGNASACAAEGKGRPYNNRVIHCFHYAQRICQCLCVAAPRHLKANSLHGLLEQLPVLCLFYSMEFCAYEFNAVFFKHA